MFLLWLLAVVIGIAGIVSLFRGQILWGVVLIILAFVVGPGGYSIFDESVSLTRAPGPGGAGQAPGSVPTAAILRSGTSPS